MDFHKYCLIEKFDKVFLCYIYWYSIYKCTKYNKFIMFIVHVVVKVEKFNNRFLKNWMQKKICFYHVYLKKNHIYMYIHASSNIYMYIHVHTSSNIFF